MKIEMILYASLGKLSPGKSAGESFTVDLEDEATVQDALKKVGIDPKSSLIIFVNGRHSKFDGVLKEGDRLAIFPPIAGG